MLTRNQNNVDLNLQIELLDYSCNTWLYHL